MSDSSPPVRFSPSGPWLRLLAPLLLGLAAACGNDTSAPSAPLTRAERFQMALDSVRLAHDVIGVSAAVTVPGEGTWVGASGNSHPGTPLRPDMVFGIASITKTFVAALVLKLAEEGLVTLEDSLHEWLPVFPNIDTNVTIRQLLNHTSGVFDYINYSSSFWPAVTADLSRAWTPEEALAFVEAPRFAAGTAWDYSNTGYILLGMIIRQATGGSVSAALRTRLLTPLNLTHTFLDVEETVIGDVAHGWSDFFNGGQGLDDISSLPRTGVFSVAWTAGAMFSTAGELATWANALYSGSVLTQASRNQMLTFYPVTPTPAHPYTGYGLGVQRYVQMGVEAWGHGGFLPMGGYSSLLLYLPADGLTMALLVNQPNVNFLVGLVTALFEVAQAEET